MTPHTTTTPSDVHPDGVESRTVDSNGTLFYWDADERLHNPTGPAVIRADRATYWLVTGRDPGEKSKEWFGVRSWYLHGQRHRTNGPAIEFADGTGYFYVDGIHLTERQFHLRFPEYLGNVATDDQS